MYEKQTWKTGDVITEEKLNHMEEGIASGGGLYTATNTVRLVKQSFAGNNESNYYEAELDGNAFFDDVVKVIFDGKEYICEAKEGPGYCYYGGSYNDETDQYDFSEYPFVLETYDSPIIYVADGNQHTVEVLAKEGTVDIGFAKAINNDVCFTINDNDDDGSFDKSWQEIYNALNANKVVRYYYRNSNDITACLVIRAYEEDGTYCVQMLSVNKSNEVKVLRARTNSPTGYPNIVG